jgi:hypothetical protein
VLKHVRPQVLVRRAVERAEEGGDGECEPEREERGAIPAGEVGAAPAAQADGALREEKRGEPG